MDNLYLNATSEKEYRDKLDRLWIEVFHFYNKIDALVVTDFKNPDDYLQELSSLQQEREIISEEARAIELLLFNYYRNK